MFCNVESSLNAGSGSTFQLLDSTNGSMSLDMDRATTGSLYNE